MLSGPKYGILLGRVVMAALPHLTVPLAFIAHNLNLLLARRDDIILSNLQRCLKYKYINIYICTLYMANQILYISYSTSIFDVTIK